MTSNTALTRDEIREKLIALIKEQLSTPDVIEDDMSFTKDLGADSLDVVDLVINIEESFELDIPDEDSEGIQTVGDVIDYIIKAQEDQ